MGTQLSSVHLPPVDRPGVQGLDQTQGAIWERRAKRHGAGEGGQRQSAWLAGIFGLVTAAGLTVNGAGAGALTPPPWNELFHADGTLVDELNADGTPGSNGVADYVDRNGGEAFVIRDRISAGVVEDRTVLSGSGEITRGYVAAPEDLGNALVYIDPNRVIHLGIERLDDSLDQESTIDLELNKNKTYVNFVGETGTLYQQRADGDLRIAVNLAAGGMPRHVKIAEWQTDPITAQAAWVLLREQAGNGSWCIDVDPLYAVCSSPLAQVEEPNPEDAAPPNSLLEVSLDQAHLAGSILRGAEALAAGAASGGSYTPAANSMSLLAVSGYEASALSYTCLNDADGANDVPGQKDLTQFCIDEASTNPLNMTWNWDETSLGGTNTGDGCALFDSDGDGNVNYALCNQWSGLQAQSAGYPKLYSCGDDKPRNCTSATELTPSTTSCSIANSTDDPFAGGASYPNDTKSTCSIAATDVGGTGSTLLDVCSYASASPDSSASDCIVVSLSKGNLEIEKDVVPDDSSTNWLFSISGPTPFTNLPVSGDGTTGNKVVDTGSYNITEAAGSPTSLGDYDTTWACTKNGAALSSGSGTSITGVSIAKGDIVVCTFTNTRKTGSLQIVKDVVPNDSATNWSFAWTGPTPGSCSIAGDGSCTAQTVATGSYSIAETAGAGTSLADYDTTWACTVNGAAGASGSGTTISGVSITKNDIVVCTFTNTRKYGSLEVTKVVNWSGITPDTSKTFEICITGPSYATPNCKTADYDGATLTWSNNLLPGNYTVTETNPGELWSVSNTGSPATVVANATATAIVTNTRLVPAITITKTADPTSVPENGGNVTFTFLVSNTGPVAVTLNSLLDDKFANLAGQGTCVTGSTIAAGSSYTCTYSVNLASDTLTAHTNKVTATATDSGGASATDDDFETVTFTDVLPAVDLAKTVTPATLAEPGGVFTYTLTITNNSVEAVTLTALTDTNALSAECQALVGTSLAAGATTSCTYSVTHTEAGSYPNTASVTVKDNENNTASDSDAKTVTVTDVLPTITVDKTANPTAVPEPGGNVLFTFRVTNTSVEVVTIASVTDTDFTLMGDGDCQVGTVLPVGGSCDFSQSVYIAGDASGPVHSDTFTATATDNEGNTASHSDGATVGFDNVPPTVDLTKGVTPTSLPEPGGVFTYTLSITNTSVEPVEITALTDDNPLSAECQALVGTSLAAGATTSCTYSVTHTEAGSYPNTASVTVKDNENNTASDSDTKTVTVTDVLPAVDLTKDVTPASLPEPGGVFTYTLTIHNTSVEAVTLTGLTDTNALSAECQALVGTSLAAGATTSCTYSVTHTEAGIYPNTASVTVKDNENNTASDSDTKTVTVTDVLPTITVDKTANPTAVPETGGNVVFTFVVTNNSVEPVKIATLSDSVFGTLAGDVDCQVGTVLAAGASCEFSFTQWVEGDYSGPDHVNLFTATATDNEGNTASASDDATVDFTNVLPMILVTKTANPTSVPETGGDVVFTFVVKNTSSDEPVTLTSLSDSVYGTLAGDADCQVGTVLAAGASCEFSFTQWVEGDYSGPDHVNVFTAHADDNDKTDASDSDDATVDFTNVLPTIEVTKTANPTAVPETGGDVLFTFVVKNTSSEEPVTLISLSDSVYGTLDGDDDCKVGTVLAAGASCEFSITKWVEGDYSGPDHVNVFTAKAVDNDGSEATDDDDATVDFTDVAPTIEVTKTANPTSVPETGGNVTFTFVVKNTSSEEPVTITSLSDSLYGTLTGDDDCKVGTVLVANASCEFSITKWVAGDYESGISHVNVLTAKAVDNDSTEATDDDDATVTFTDVTADISIVKVTVDGSTSGDGLNFLTSETIGWKYTVTNVGNVTLSNVTVTDSKGVTVTCPKTTLAVGESMTCTASGTAITGAYSNTGTAYGDFTDGAGNIESDTASDGSSYFGANPQIAIVKVTVDGATSGDGLNILTGESIGWKYTVTNVGNVALSNVAVTDNRGVAVTCPKTTLAVGESMDCTASGTAITGAYSNTGTASGEYTDSAGHSRTDIESDISSYFGADPRIDIVKTTVGYDGTEGDDVFVLSGATVTWKYYVTNTGNVALSSVTVADDKGVAVTCPKTTLTVGESMTCTASGTAITGAYSNTGTASGTYTDSGGHSRTGTDTDPSSYFGAAPAIDVKKEASIDNGTTWEDANSAPGPSVTEGSSVQFRFTVTNTGNVDLSSVTLTDSDFDLSSCTVPTSLAVGASFSCTITHLFAEPVSHDNLATATGSYGGTAYSDTDPAYVTVTNVLPTIDVTKTANPTYVLIPGGDVTFTFVVKNTSKEPVTITSLSDSVYGTLAGDTDCKVGTVLAAGASCDFTITRYVSGTVPAQHKNVFTAKAVDNDGSEATDDDDATVDILAPTSKIAPTQTTCQMYRDGTAQDYTTLQYLVSKNKVGSVSPGVIFFWSTVTAPAESFSLEGHQLNNSGTLAWKDMANLDVFLWDASCNKVQTVTLTRAGDGHPILGVTGATPGATYYFSVKYDTSSLTGIAVKKPYPTVKYTFQTWLDGSFIITSPDSVAVTPKK